MNGESGIRTRGGGVYHLTGLANRRIRPLCHLSRENYNAIRYESKTVVTALARFSRIDIVFE